MNRGKNITRLMGIAKDNPDFIKGLKKAYKE
jgi:predicted signal transduction protein with EAL and GGDEF domain